MKLPALPIHVGVLLAGVFWVGNSFAQSSATLKLQQILESLETRHPLVVSAILEQGRAEADRLSAEGAFDLTLKSSVVDRPLGYYRWNTFDSVIEKPTTLWGSRFFTGYRLGMGNAPIYEQKQMTVPAGEIRVGFEVPLIRNGPTDARRTQLQKVEWGVSVAQMQRFLEKLEVSRLATQRYWDWVGAVRRVAIVERLYVMAQERDVAMSHRAKMGDLPTVDVLDNQRSLLQRKQQVVIAKRALQKAAIDLSIFYRDAQGGCMIPDSISAPAEFPETTADLEALGSSDKQILNRVQINPEVTRITLQQDQNEADWRLARNQLLPRLDIRLQSSKDMDSSAVYKDKTPAELEIGVWLEIPLETRLPRGRIENFALNSNRLDQQMRLAADRVRARLLDTSQAMRAAHERIEIAKTEFTLAKQVELGEQRRFAQGDSNLIFVNQREQNSAEAGIRWVDSEVDFQKAKADFVAAFAQQM